MTFAWAWGAAVVFFASLAIGLAGFGNGLISMALLPFVMAPATAAVIVTGYTVALALGMFLHLWRDFVLAGITRPLLGTVIGMPFGLWALSTIPADGLRRFIGFVLIVVVIIEWCGLSPRTLSGPCWAVGAGMLSGVLGAGVGTPGPPVILWTAAQQWEPRTMKANLQAFFVVNQAVILAGYWWGGFLTWEVARIAASFAAPALLGVFAGVALFDRIDPVHFRRIVFTLLFFSGLVLLVRG